MEGITRSFVRTLRDCPFVFLVALILGPSFPGGLCARAADPNPPPRPRATFPDGHAFLLEIARTPAQRALGYMFRERVRRHEGMLFIFPESDFHSFWMKNCRVALDILWLEEDFSVVHLEREVPPCRQDPCPNYRPMRKARYVLEVRAGMTRRVRIGDRVRFEGVDWEAPIPP